MHRVRVSVERVAAMFMGWPWLKILKIALPAIATAAIPLVLWSLGQTGARELWDVNLLEKFKIAHSDPDPFRRRLSPYIVRQMKSPDLQQQLRQFIFWDIMERKLTGPNAVDDFDADDQDWHLLGDAMRDMKEARDRGAETRDFQHWWCDQEAVAFDERWPERWPFRDELYAYLDHLYFGDEWKDDRAQCAPDRWWTKLGKRIRG
jgi:hypothetical protein